MKLKVGDKVYFTKSLHHKTQKLLTGFIQEIIGKNAIVKRKCKIKTRDRNRREFKIPSIGLYNRPLKELELY